MSASFPYIKLIPVYLHQIMIQIAGEEFERTIGFSIKGEDNNEKM